VVAFGSVPLKTYLPDGDVDLSLVGRLSDDEWPAAVLQALQAHAAFLGLSDAFAVHAEARAARGATRAGAWGWGRGRAGDCAGGWGAGEADTPGWASRERLSPAPPRNPQPCAQAPPPAR